MGEQNDDDYTFGDFTFASFPSHQQTQINFTPNPAESSVDGDDDWSDFVKSPIQSDADHMQGQLQSKPIDPFGFFPQNNDIGSNLSGSTHVKKNPGWEKPKGPLPLSLFGDMEEEEEEKKGSSIDDPQGGGYGKGSSPKVQNGSSNVSANVGLNDMISNLYSYKSDQLIKADGNGFVSSGKGSNLDTRGVDSNNKDISSASIRLKNDLDSKDQDAKKNENAFSFDIDGMVLSRKESNLDAGLANSNDKDPIFDNGCQAVNNEDKFKLSSNGSALNQNADALGFDIGGRNMNFTGMTTSLSPILNDQSKPNQGDNEVIRSEHSQFNPNQDASSPNLRTPSSDFGGWSWDFGGFSSGSDMLNASFNASSSNSNGVSSTSRKEELPANGDGIDDVDDDGWDFKTAFSEAKAAGGVDKADPKTREISNINAQSSGFGSGSNGSIDLFAFSDGSVDLFSLSNGVPNDSGKAGSDFNMVPTTAAQIRLNSDTSISKSSEFKFGLDPEVGETDDNDEDFGEFTAAIDETRTNNVGEIQHTDTSDAETKSTTFVAKNEVKASAKVHDVSQLNEYLSSSANGSTGAVDWFASPSKSIDFSTMSHGPNSASLGFDTDFHTVPHTVAQTGFISDRHLNNEQTDSVDGLDNQPVIVGAEDDEDFGEFAAAFPETEQENEGDISTSHPQNFKEMANVGKDLAGKESGLENKKGALPLSIFGDEELEVHDTLNSQKDFLHSASLQRNGPSPAAAISINDLISNLYGTALQNSSVDIVHDASNVKVTPSAGVDSNLHDHHDAEFDESSWEFRDASAQARAENEKSLWGPEYAQESSSPKVDAQEGSPPKVTLTDYVDLYSKLKDVLGFVVKSHLENLEAAKLGDDQALAHDEEIQEVFKQLDLQEDTSDQHPDRSSRDELFIALQEKKFQILESEYGLSQKFSSADKDLRSALDLRKHAVTMLKILSLGSSKDHLTYVSLWSKMLSACLLELRSGATIWNQSVDKNIVKELLSVSEGKKFIQALSEIYRVTMVLGVTSKLYKPWTFEISGESEDIYALLEECNSIWSASGIEEAILDLLHSTSIDDNGGLEALMDSIKYIRGVNLLTFQDQILTEEGSRCRLSLLTKESIPGIKMAAWDGKQYFVKLANLWANLISSDPPSVPDIDGVGL